MLIKVILITISCRPLFMLLWGRQLQECWKTKTSSMRIMNHKFFLNHCVTVLVCLFSRIGGIQPITCTLGNSGTLNSLWLNWIVCSKGMYCQLPTDPSIDPWLTLSWHVDQHLSQQWVRGNLFFTDRPLSRVCTDPGKPGKSWNFIMAFSRTGESWKKATGPGKFWKSAKLN